MTRIKNILGQIKSAFKKITSYKIPKTLKVSIIIIFSILFVKLTSMHGFANEPSLWDVKDNLEISSKEIIMIIYIVYVVAAVAFVAIALTAFKGTSENGQQGQNNTRKGILLLVLAGFLMSLPMVKGVVTDALLGSESDTDYHFDVPTYDDAFATNNPNDPNR